MRLPPASIQPPRIVPEGGQASHCLLQTPQATGKVKTVGVTVASSLAGL